MTLNIVNIVNIMNFGPRPMFNSEPPPKSA